MQEQESDWNIPDFFPLDINNLTVVDTPLLKEYYWLWLNIPELNNTILNNRDQQEISFNTSLPRMPLNAMPLKLVLHISNVCQSKLNWSLKRFKQCNCAIQDVRVGINLYRKMYTCPHKSLLGIHPTAGVIEPLGTFTLTLYLRFYVLGTTTLSYDLLINNYFRLRWNFIFEICEFDLLSCVLTKELFPIFINSTEQLTQPIWIFNQYTQDMILEFESNELGLDIVTKTLFVQRYSITPLLVKFIPHQMESFLLKLTMYYAGIANNFQVWAPISFSKIPVPFPQSPIDDITTPEAPFILSENFVTNKLNIHEDNQTMIVVHNYSDKCVEFLWREYYLESYFKIKVVPNSLVCKPNDAELCLVQIRAYDNPCVFGNVPLACEVREYVMQDQLQQDEIYENFGEDKKSKTLSRLWLNVNITILGDSIAHIPKGYSELQDEAIICPIPSNFDLSIFDKIFWNFIFSDNFITNSLNNRSMSVSYQDLEEHAKDKKLEAQVDRREMLNILRQMLADAVVDISKRWKFIPQDFVC